MKLRFLSPLLLVALLVAACGSTSARLDPTDIAVVGSIHITQAMYNTALSEEKASEKAAGQTFPAAGSTGYAALKTNIVDRLVQEAEFQAEAAKLGIAITAKQVQTGIENQVIKKYFKGSEKKYLAGIKQQGFTDAELRANMKERLLEQKLYDEVTKDAKPTAAEIAAYYAQNISQYQQPASRQVEEILVGKNKKALAQQIYNEVKSGTSFASLAKKYSQDPGSKNIGGKFTAKQGSDVPEFDAAVFATTAKTGVLLEPVNTKQYGWFVIEPLAAIVPATTTSEKKAAPAIRKQLETTKQQQAASDWVTGITKNYCSGGKIKYQAGYAPSPDPCTSVSTGNATTT
jgi:parvulin-like peptidyl-prolyl isomerase